mmetsp:Transcript_31213/g.50078  ORF Transcript_31213/g.50078 Transcript_31213/m.50078 type:complete len:91 (-) Transcript_31213:122-394(-)
MPYYACKYHLLAVAMLHNANAAQSNCLGEYFLQLGLVDLLHGTQPYSTSANPAELGCLVKSFAINYLVAGQLSTTSSGHQDTTALGQLLA